MDHSKSINQHTKIERSPNIFAPAHVIVGHVRSGCEHAGLASPPSNHSRVVGPAEFHERGAMGGGPGSGTRWHDPGRRDAYFPRRESLFITTRPTGFDLEVFLLSPPRPRPAALWGWALRAASRSGPGFAGSAVERRRRMTQQDRRRLAKCPSPARLPIRPTREGCGSTLPFSISSKPPSSLPQDCAPATSQRNTSDTLHPPNPARTPCSLLPAAVA